MAASTKNCQMTTSESIYMLLSNVEVNEIMSSTCCSPNYMQNHYGSFGLLWKKNFFNFVFSFLNIFLDYFIINS